MHRLLRLATLLLIASSLAGTGATFAVPAAAQETGAIRILLRACPEGPINPNTNSLDTCTTPLDAPDAARATWPGIDTAITVADAPREFNGAYLIEDIPAGTEVRLAGFQPVAHNYYGFIGVDDNLVDGPWVGHVTATPGVTRDVIVFYWNGEDGFREQEDAALELKLRGCPEGVDPYLVADPADACDVPIDAPDDARLIWDMEGGALVANQPRLNDGTYRIADIPPFMTVGLTGFEPSVRDAYMVVGHQRTDNGVQEVDLYRGETIRLHIYYYWEGGSGEAGSGPGTIDITLRACPEGVDPSTIADPAAACTIPLDAPEPAGVIWGGDGQGGVELYLQDRLFDGTYHVTNVPSGVTIRLAGFEPTVRDSYLFTGDVSPTLNSDAELYVAPGGTYHVFVYYFNAV